jgi:osmotically-inducible protein OsmY
METGESVKYVVAHVREALAEDERTNLLDVQVRVEAGKLYLFGQVVSRERREAAEQVAREIAPPDMPLVNELWVETYLEPSEPELLP